jgi:hypothetical protein
MTAKGLRPLGQRTRAAFGSAHEDSEAVGSPAAAPLTAESSGAGAVRPRPTAR